MNGRIAVLNVVERRSAWLVLLAHVCTSCRTVSFAIAWLIGNSVLCAQSQGPAQNGSADGNTSYTRDSTIVEKGKTLFTQQCAACHTLVQDGLGPPLGGVTFLLPKSQLVQWIREPAGILESGDARAKALLRRYKVPMPPFAHLANDDIVAILTYIDQQSTEQNLTPFAVDTTTPATEPVRWSPPVKKTNLAVELEDVAQISRLPGRTPYKGITLLRADPRDAGALLVDELMGLLYRVKGGEVSVFLDVRGFFPEFLCDPGVASGFGSFALHPEFVQNGIFYTMHSEAYRGSPAVNAADIPADVPPSTSPRLEWVLTEWRLSDRAATSFTGTHREVLRFVSPTTAHAAQEIAFVTNLDQADPDYGKLYIAIGDGGAANLKRPDMAGHPRTFLGAILRIDPAGRDGANGRYGIPTDNPFASTEDPSIRKEIWAYGFRNPHRISWDLTHGKRMIAVDIGEANVEEVNLIERGGAYGWGVASIEGRTRIDVKTDLKVVRAATPAELSGVRAPIGEYDHVDGAAITGGYVYRGPIKVLQGKYIFGDIVNGRLFYMNMGADINDPSIYEIAVVRGGVETTVKELAQANRAHLRIGYDDRTGDMFVLTKDDGMIRKITTAYER